MKRRLHLSQKIRIGKPMAVDLVARKGTQKLAFEIETGSNSLDQMVQNLSKGLSEGCDRVYLIPTSQRASKSLCKLMGNSFNCKFSKNRPGFIEPN